MRLIDIGPCETHGHACLMYATEDGGLVQAFTSELPTIDAVPVAEIKDYLQKRLDEWEALGDRKFEPANMWGYNFIMACFDDLERKDGDG